MARCAPGCRRARRTPGRRGRSRCGTSVSSPRTQRCATCGGVGEDGARRGAARARCRGRSGGPPARGAAARRRGGVQAGRLPRGARGVRARARGRLDQRAGAVSARDPRQLGRQALAEGYAARARVLAPQDRSVLELEWELRAAVRPSVRTTVDGAGDSDGNTFVAQEAYYEASLSTAVRGTLRAGWRRASFDTVAAGSSFGVGGQISAPLGAKAAVQAGLGVRRLDPDGGAGTTPLTAALGLRLRPGRYVAGG